MSRIQMSMLLLAGLTCLGVLADSVLKLASAERVLLSSKWLWLGLTLSCVFALGWLFLMRVMKLSTAGVLYGVTSALILCVIGVLFFDEQLSRVELAGVATGMVAIALLSTGG